MKTLVKLLLIAWISFSPSIGARAENSGFRLPTVSQVQNNFHPMLEFYKIKDGVLGCTLPTGAQVGVFLVNDPAGFTFLAVRSRQGPAILANEKFIHATKLEYSVYSFYRECGVHAVSKVVARGPDDGVADLDTVLLAECLAAIPTQTTLKSRQISWPEIARLLRAEYGEQSSTSAEMVRCLHPEYVRRRTAKAGF
jgi:hypothetical protein